MEPSPLPAAKKRKVEGGALIDQPDSLVRLTQKDVWKEFNLDICANAILDIATQVGEQGKYVQQ